MQRAWDRQLPQGASSKPGPVCHNMDRPVCLGAWRGWEWPGWEWLTLLGTAFVGFSNSIKEAWVCFP